MAASPTGLTGDRAPPRVVAGSGTGHPNEEQLSAVLSEFARTMLTDFPIQAILDRLVQRIVDVLPISAAGVTLISPGADPRYVAASDPSALRFEELQSDVGEGPCILAYLSGEAVAEADLRQENRFPEFTPLALVAGLIAVFTFPLRDGDHQLGALDLYRETPGPLDDEAMNAAQTLADVASAYLLNAQARDDLRASSDQHRQEALHDGLTGLPNRVLLLERLHHADLRARRSRQASAVLFVDLDRFKQVNDWHGHDVGDELLVGVAQRLTAVLRPGDTLARMSGDEFVVLCEDIHGAAEAEMIASRVLAAVATPFLSSRGEVRVSASIGIGFRGPGDQLSEDVLRESDMAMYQAKRQGGGRYQIVDITEQHLADERVGLQRDLDLASAHGELRLEYQPIVSTVDSRIVGAEALLRWDHPTRGPVPPTRFVPLAEERGLITDIGRWVLAEACTDRRSWQQARLHSPIEPEAGAANSSTAPTIAVNISAHQLMSPNFTASVAAVLLETGTTPDLLTLELTESVFVQDSERANVVLGDLKELGVHLALDDFGTGYSSMTYLKRFPIDTVKIDQAFVSDLLHDAASLAIVTAVIELAHALRMQVVAEGVETAAQHTWLTTLGCDLCQGFYLARPMPAADLPTSSQSRPSMRLRVPKG